MSKWRWSRLYPRAWRAEFGEEFDAMTEQMSIGPREIMDMVGHALILRLNRSAKGAPWLVAWSVIGWLNIVANEVQWPAGALLLASGVAAALFPKRWFKSALLFASAIPISSLYLFQIPGIHHEPLYHTIIALIPALIGALGGLMVNLAISPPMSPPA